MVLSPSGLTSTLDVFAHVRRPSDDSALHEGLCERLAEVVTSLSPADLTCFGPNKEGAWAWRP